MAGGLHETLDMDNGPTSVERTAPISEFSPRRARARLTRVIRSAGRPVTNGGPVSPDGLRRDELSGSEFVSQSDEVAVCATAVMVGVGPRPQRIERFAADLVRAANTDRQPGSTSLVSDGDVRDDSVWQPAGR